MKNYIISKMEGELHFVPIMLKLPDGRFVLQRRTDDAPYEEGKLGMFGGGVEPDETPEECMRRELFDEETSLNPDDVIDLRIAKKYMIPASDEFPEDRHFTLYEAVVLHIDFEVYEGQGVEAYSLDELKSRTDLMATTTYLLRTVLKLF
jgi:8-oxo-dGTP pyrophosphatase MutT (NUDIX family)